MWIVRYYLIDCDGEAIDDISKEIKSEKKPTPKFAAKELGIDYKLIFDIIKKKEYLR